MKSKGKKALITICFILLKDNLRKFYILGLSIWKISPYEPTLNFSIRLFVGRTVSAI